ncbi:Large ribosomal subunit protein bL28 [Candidatus Xenohaliotis californiensis]|uniref:Large ribosomal subunit protein bL28 n=1 Tax=Candidatus Xenohaliotis californiensis TaxID=84677 RepID=A0ABP0ETL7_9RICK|nr:Large ribosomal subunit protein bL28 [Candidatus Xenohaliotis californiensis]
MARVCELTGKSVATGHKVSHSNHKTKRKFAPNLISAKLFSSMLKQNFTFRLAASTLRTIDYRGGLDQFLMRSKNGKLTTLAKKIKKKISLNNNQC